MKAVVIKLLAITGLVILVPFSSKAQSKWSLKLIQNTDVFTTSYYYLQSNLAEEDRKVSIRFSVAADLTGKRFHHEFELFMPDISRPVDKVNLPWSHAFMADDGFRSKVNTYAFRYTIYKDLYAFSDDISLSMGLGLNPYFIGTEYSPKTSYAYQRERQIFGASVNVVPGLSVRLSEHFGVAVSFPVKMYDFWRVEERVNNPGIPIRQQRWGEWKGDFFMNAYSARLAFAYNL